MNTFSVVVSFYSTMYTVTEGVDKFAELNLVRSEDLSKSTAVIVRTSDASAIGKIDTQ